MTLNEIKTNRIDAAELLKSLRPRTYADAINGTLGLEAFLTIQTDNTGKQYDNQDYLSAYVRAAITMICSSNKRNNAMTDDDKEALAEMIINYGLAHHYTIEDIKLWALEVNCNNLATGPKGREEYELKAVDGSALYEKLKSYDRKRGEEIYKLDAQREAQRAAQAAAYEAMKPLDEYQLTHDYEGNYKGNDPHWNPYLYWKSYPTQEELETVIFPRIKAQLSELIKNA